MKSQKKSLRNIGPITIVVIALVLAACSAPAGSPKATNGGPAAGGAVVVARTGDVDQLDPHLATSLTSLQALDLIYEHLFSVDANLEPQPGLAEKWSYSDDGMTFNVSLRDGVQFHDGNPMTADDVKASIERILDEKTGAVARSNLLSISKIEVSDELALAFQLSEPDATLPAALSDRNTSIISAAAIEAGTVGNKPDGTGPFSFDDWTQGQAFKVVANESYWGDGPFLESVTIRTVDDESSILAGIRANEFQMGLITDTAVIDQLDSGNDDELEVFRTPETNYWALMLNSDRPNLDDRNVRQAISCAIDREQVIEAANFGQGVVASPFTIPAYATDPYDGLPCTPPDLDKAKELLVESGHGDDEISIGTIVMTQRDVIGTRIGQNLQSQLKAIGINLELELLPVNTFVDRWLDADFDSAISFNIGAPDPHLLQARNFMSSGSLNYVSKYSSDHMDQLFAQGRTETDLSARKTIYAEIAKELVEESPYVFLFSGFQFQVAVPEVQGFVPSPLGSLRSLGQVKLG